MKRRSAAGGGGPAAGGGAPKRRRPGPRFGLAALVLVAVGLCLAAIAGAFSGGPSSSGAAIARTGSGDVPTGSTAKRASALALQVTDPRGANHRAVGTADASKLKYGGLPSWLPKAKKQIVGIPSARPGHPVLQVEGEPIALSGPGWSMVANAVGPSEPATEGKPPLPETSPAKFILSISSVHGEIPFKPSQIEYVDEYGNVRHPRVTMLDGGSAPSELRPGAPLRLEVYGVIPVGNGAIEWKPSSGVPIANWDFVVEVD
jgi:hypothetical protein